MSATIAAMRIEYVAEQAQALGCRVTDEWENGVRIIHVHSRHLLDADSVLFRYTPASGGRRATLHIYEFNRRRYPRKGYSWVSYADGLFAMSCLRDYSTHTYCGVGRHYCDKPKCTAPRGDSGKPCGLPRALHFAEHDDHTFTTEETS